MKFIFVLILFAFALSGCKKTEPTTVSGFVLETGAEKPIPFGTIFIEEDVGTHTNRIVTSQADVNGFFNITFAANSKSKYGLDGMANHCNNIVQFIPLTNGKTNELNFHLQPFCFIKVHAVKQSSDTLFIGRNVYASDTVYFFELKANKPDNLRYFLMNGDKFELHEVPFTIAGFDTVPYLLNY